MADFPEAPIALGWEQAVELFYDVPEPITLSSTIFFTSSVTQLSFSNSQNNTLQNYMLPTEAPAQYNTSRNWIVGSIDTLGARQT